MIEVFKTNIQNKTQSRNIIKLLTNDFVEAKINFDLHNCDRILRVDGIRKEHIQHVINNVQSGFKCEILN